MIQPKTILATIFFAAGFLASAGTSWGLPQNDTPQIKNAQQETRAVSQGLSAAVGQLAAETTATAWIGYLVAEVPGEGLVCCGNYNWNYGNQSCGTCALENTNNGFNTRNDGGTLNLEGSKTLVVLLRMADRHVMRIRLASADCTLDAGGLRLVWLTGVKPEESVGLLSKYVRTEDFRDEGDHATSGQALAAIALHADFSADRAFAVFVAPEQPAVSPAGPDPTTATRLPLGGWTVRGIWSRWVSAQSAT